MCRASNRLVARLERRRRGGRSPIGDASLGMQTSLLRTARAGSGVCIPTNVSANESIW